MSITAELSEVARVRVIYGDTDQMGMVYYGNYLRYFEIARNEFLRRAGAPYRAFEETHGLRLPVIEATVTTGGRRSTTTSWGSSPPCRW